MERLELSYTGRASRIKILPRHNPSGLSFSKGDLVVLLQYLPATPGLWDFASLKMVRDATTGQESSAAMTPSLRQDMSASRQREGFQDISSFPPCKNVFQIIRELAMTWQKTLMNLFGNYWEVSNNPKESVEDTWFLFHLRWGLNILFPSIGWLQRDQEEAGQGRVQAVGFLEYLQQNRNLFPSICCVFPLSYL